jgi:hypothetical protein
MSEIGETLRESRMRRRIDMAEVESATKIRAKYLRALENEEWDLLPGPTFVKTFLRTYAEYLELDARTLVEEYKQRFERPSGAEPAAFGGLAPGRRPQRPQRRSVAAFGPVAVVAVLALALLGILYVLGKTGQDSGSANTTKAASPTPAPAVAATPSPAQQGTGRSARVSLRLEATGNVSVCLVDAAGKRLLDGVTLRAGERSGPFRSRVLRANFGGSTVRMRVGGRSFGVARGSGPVGYELRPGRPPRRLSDTRRPSCA